MIMPECEAEIRAYFLDAENGEYYAEALGHSYRFHVRQLLSALDAERAAHTETKWERDNDPSYKASFELANRDAFKLKQDRDAWRAAYWALRDALESVGNYAATGANGHECARIATNSLDKKPPGERP